MTYSPLIFVHVCCAVVGLLSGFMALFFRKGSSLHAAAGTIFFVSMLIMSATAACIAAFLRPVMINVVAGLLTFYLVSTAWWAAKRRDGSVGIFDVAALVWAFGVGVAGWGFGFQAVQSGTGRVSGIPAPIYFIFGSVALLCAVSDARMLVRGGVAGAERIARHLWRMCLALAIATLSFYPGQAKLFSKAVRATNLLYVPHILLAGSMMFWTYRVLVRKRIRHDKLISMRPRAVSMVP